VPRVLEQALAYGLYAGVVLYDGMKIKENFERSRQRMADLKGCPGVLGYGFMDEPFVWGTEPWEMNELRKRLGDAARLAGLR